MQTPVADLSGRELTMQTPATGISGRELTMQTPATGLSGRELTMQTPATGLSGRELTMQTPATGISGREMTLETAGTGVTGREMTLETPATGISGREMTMQGPATPTPATVGGKPRTDMGAGGFKPRTGVGTSIAFDDAWHLQGRKGPHTGQSWGDFDLGGILGEGGMGAVYRAKQRSLRRRVAIKVLPPNLSADARLLQRFQLEATTTSKLQTPHVVQVYAIGEHEGNHFYAMEYVEGKDLYDIIKDRREQSKPLTPDEACNYIVQAAKGLAEAGRHQIVHRDIKPPNMMVTKDGLLKIADFGIVKVLGEHNLTMTGQAVGTPAYVSPEQGRGDREVDCRSDLYSLGVVFYELVCDKKPFDGSTPNALIYQHCYEEPKLPKELNAAISDEIQAVIMRCLQKKPENRYQSAEDLVRDLEAIRTGSMLKSAIANYKLGTGADEAKREQMTWLQRNMLPVAAAALLVIGGGVAGGWWYLDREAKEQARLAELRGQGETAILEKRGAIAKALDVVAPIPDGIDARIAELARIAKDGEADADIVRWRRKLGEVAALNVKLAPVETAAPTPALRSTARVDLDALLAKVGDGDPAAGRYVARLKGYDEAEARLRNDCARLDTLALRLGDRKRYGDLLADLGRLIPAEDPQLSKWNRKLAGFDQELAVLRAKIAPLDADEQVTVAKRALYLPVLTDLKIYLDEGDKDLVRWTEKLDSAGGRVVRLREDIVAVVGAQPDAIAKPKQDQVASKLADYEALAGVEDPQLKDWKGAIAAAERAITGGRERLNRFLADSGDGLLPVGVQPAFERELGAVAGLLYQGDAEVQKWQAALVDSRRVVDGLQRDCAVLDPSATAGVTLAVQQDLAPKVDRLAAKGGVDPARAQLWRDRLAAEANRVATLREGLAVFDRAEPVSEATRSALGRLAIDAGSADPDVRRWTAKRDRIDGLVERLSALDKAQGVPEDVGALFAELASLVGDKDANLVRWKGAVTRIGEARRALAVLDRRATFPADQVGARLHELEGLVGDTDRHLVAWKAKAAEVARLKAQLATLGAALSQTPEANQASHAWLRRLVADLVGPDDPEVRAGAIRQQQLDGPPRPSWAVDEGRDDFGRWADADIVGVRQRLRWLPAAAATVGSPEGEPNRDDDELRVQLRLPRGFWIADSEVTRGLWSAVLATDPSRARSADPARLPVERVSWGEAEAFCGVLRQRHRLPARLPLEAEWELAARAGSDAAVTLPEGAAAGATGLGTVAWCADNAGGGPQPVAARLPNPLGLYDLLGNVSEWCADAYAPYPTGGGEVSGAIAGGERKVVRGGSWGDPWWYCRSANRIPVRPALTSAYVGLRLVADAEWGGQAMDGGAVLTRAGTGAAKVIEFGLGTWRIRVAQGDGK